MEPVYIYKPTGETRCPVEGELIRRCGANIDIAVGKDCSYQYPIYKRIAIPVPEGATRLSYQFDKGGRSGNIELFKSKTIKWIWERSRTFHSEKLKIVTTTPMTESELKEIAAERVESFSKWNKVPGSRVEE